MIEPTEIRVHSIDGAREEINNLIRFSNKQNIKKEYLFIKRIFVDFDKTLSTTLHVISTKNIYKGRSDLAIYYVEDKDKIFYICGNVNYKEIFIEIAKEKYPDVFEWLLFNPEWL